MKRIIEIEDNLEVLIRDCRQELLEQFVEFLEQNPDTNNFETFYQNCGCDAVHQICDDNLPTYNKEVKDLFYLYGNELEEAFESAGFEAESEHYEQTALYCYLTQETFEYMNQVLEKDYFPIWQNRNEELFNFLEPDWPIWWEVMKKEWFENLNEN